METTEAHMGDDLLSITPAAHVCGVSTDTLRRWANAGDIEAVRVAGGLRLFRRTHLEDAARVREALR